MKGPRHRYEVRKLLKHSDNLQDIDEGMGRLVEATEDELEIEHHERKALLDTLIGSSMKDYVRGRVLLH